jgi:4-hydroxybenzoate polyprenyltransferase
VNKPSRPLPSGALSRRQAWVFTAVTCALVWVLAWLATPRCGAHECFWIVVVTTGLCWIYSAPPIWTKRRGIWANITIAIPRGVLLKVAGWATVKAILGLEPWYGNPVLLMILGPALILYGIYTVYLLVRRPEDLATTENHPSWTHMYRMMMVAQVGFALAYVF